jgi:glutathione peroxidase
MTNAHSFSFKSIDGKPMPLSGFAGKAVLVVNTASACGLTPQYKGLEALWREYKGRGLVVLGVPCNDFGAQEPGTESEIKTFCETSFGVDFPMASKEHVIGAAAHPFYQWAAKELGEGGTPRWNFHKYLLAKDGTLAGTFGSRTEPEAAEVKAAIEAALK